MVRIIFFLSSLDLGGAERQALLLAEGLRDTGRYQIAVWGFGPPGKVSALCDAKGLPWQSVDFPLWGSRPRQLAALPMLALRLRRAQPDCILSYTTPANVPCALIWRFTGARGCIWSQRDSGHDAAHMYAWPFAVRLPSHYIANSGQGVSFLVGHHIREGKVAYVPNGVALPLAGKARQEWRTAMGLPGEAVVGCMLANLHEQKGHTSLLRAWGKALASGRMPPQSVLVLAGRDGGLGEALRNLSQELDVADSVLFPGQVDDISGLLAASDLGVFVSPREGLPNAVLECMAAGLPLVASDLPGVREALGIPAIASVSRLAGNILVSFDAVEGLSEALVHMYAEPDRRAAAGTANATRCREFFSPQAMIAASETVIRSALGVEPWAEEGPKTCA